MFVSKAYYAIIVSKSTAFFKKALINKRFGAIPDVITCFLVFVPSTDIVLFGSCFVPMNHKTKFMLLEDETAEVDCAFTLELFSISLSTAISLLVCAKAEVFVNNKKTNNRRPFTILFLFVFKEIYFIVSFLSNRDIIDIPFQVRKYTICKVVKNISDKAPLYSLKHQNRDEF